MSKPKFFINDTYLECVSLITDDSIRKYLESLEISVYAYSELYGYLAENNKLNEFEIPLEFTVENNKDNEWLIKLYKNYFRNSTEERCKSAYDYYAKLKNYNIKGEISRCCYCNSQQVECLDHFLPESKFHALAVNPINLVPSCDYCNKKKGAYKPKKDEPNSVLIHPYYNDILNLEWLKMKIKIFYNFKLRIIDLDRLESLILSKNEDFKIGLVDLKKSLYAKKNVQTFFFVDKDCSFLNKQDLERIKLTFNKTDLNHTLAFEANSYFRDDIISFLKTDLYKDFSDDMLRKHYLLRSKNLMRDNGYSMNNWKVLLYGFLARYSCSFKGFY